MRHFKKAQFCIENREKEINNTQRTQFLKDKAIAEFHSLLNSDKKYLLEVLDYVGIPSSINTNEETLNSYFRRWLDDTSRASKNADFFLDKLKAFNSEKGKDELYLHKQLTDLFVKGIIKERKGEFFLDGEVLGTNLKTIAEQASSVDNKLKEIIVKTYLQEFDKK